MARIPQSHFIQGGVYHIYNRGNRKQNIFHYPKDYERYLSKLKEYKKKHDVSILAYCLMPNHIHLLIRQNGPKPLSLFIQRLHTSYSKYFNLKYKMVGHVFQDRFKAKIVNRDEYLIHVSRYIHLNPVKIVQKLPSYKWSSYNYYIGNIKDEDLDINFVLSMFRNKNQTQDDAYRNYKQFVRDQKQELYNISQIVFKEELEDPHFL